MAICFLPYKKYIPNNTCINNDDDDEKNEYNAIQLWKIYEDEIDYHDNTKNNNNSNNNNNDNKNNENNSDIYTTTNTSSCP